MLTDCGKPNLIKILFFSLLKSFFNRRDMWIKTVEKTENSTKSIPMLTAVNDYLAQNPRTESVNSEGLVYIYNGGDNETSAVWDIQGES